MSDERYERSADMRLLDLQRKALGLPQRVIGSTSYTDPETLTDISKSEDAAYIQSGAILVAATDARPRTALIPGALVTVSVSIANDGDVAARGVRIDVPLPADTTYRPGTLMIDGETSNDDIASELFGNGAELTDIEPGTRRTISIKLLIETGSNDIIVSPHLSAKSAAILGLRTMRLTRQIPSSRGNSSERPFYESDDAEHKIEPLRPVASQPAIDIRQPRESPPVIQVPMPVEQIKPVTKTVIPTVSQPAMLPVAKFVSRLVTKPASKTVTKPVIRPSSKPVVQAVAKPVVPVVTTPAVQAAPTPAARTVATPPVRAVAKPTVQSVVKPVVPSTAKPTAPAEEKAVTTRGSESKAKPKPRGNPKAKIAQPAVVAIAEPFTRPKIEVVRSVDDRISFAGQGGPILAVRIDRRRLATLTALFTGTSLGMIAHYLVLNALAVRDPLPGDGADAAIATFVASQEQLLSRALIATRLGKTPSPNSVGATLPSFPPVLATHAERRAIEPPPSGEAMLFRAFEPGEILFVQRMLSNDKASPFLRAAQLFVGLCANDAVTADERERHRVGVALTAYAALATAEISRIFLRAKLSGAPDLFKETESSFDDAARTVLVALESSIA